MKITREIEAEVTTFGELEALVVAARCDYFFDSSDEIDLSACTVRIVSEGGL